MPARPFVRATVSATVALGLSLGTLGIATRADAAQPGVPVPVERGGTLVAWGDDTAPGQTMAVPDELDGEKVLAVDADHSTVAALTSTGEVVAWGTTVYGDMAPPAPPAGMTYTAVATGFGFVLALRSDGRIFGAGRNDLGQLDVPVLPAGVTYTAVSAGTYQALAVRSDGTVVAWGGDLYGETSIPAPPPGVTYTAVTGGNLWSAALRSDGYVETSGNNTSGQRNVEALPSGTTYTAVDAGAIHGVGLRSDGSVAAWGNNDSGQTIVPPLPTGVTYSSVAGGYGHSLAVRSDGTLAAWGDNDNGETDVPDAVDAAVVSAAAAGHDFSIALVQDFAAEADPVVSGIPSQGGQLTAVPGRYNVEPDSFAFQWYADGEPVGSDAAVYRPTADDLGAEITVEVTAHSTGRPDAVTTSVATEPVAPGGVVMSWGHEFRGRVALPPALAEETVTSVAAGAELSLALTAEGRVVAWGWRTASGEVNAPPPELDGKTVTALSTRSTRAFALTDDGRLHAWGDGGTVPAGLDGETIVEVSAGSSHTLALTADGRVLGWGDNTDGRSTAPPALDGKQVVAVSAGLVHSLALTAEGEVVAWGTNLFGQTALPAELDGKTVVAISAGEIFSLALTSDGEIIWWGNDGGGGATVPPAALDDEDVVAIDIGATHAQALTAEGEVVGWGDNSGGQAATPAALAGMSTSAVSAGTNYNLAVVPRVVVERPTVAGAPQVGQVLTATLGEVYPATGALSYAWSAGGTPVGTDASTYAPTAADVGKAITVEVTASSAGYVDAASTSAPTAPVAAGVFTAVPVPTMSGTARVGSTLTAAAGSHVPAAQSVTYAWKADGVPIDGATASTLVLAPAQAGKEVTVTTTAQRAGYVDATATSSPVGPVAAADAPTVTLSAARTTARRGQRVRLTWTSSTPQVVATGAWSGTRAGSGTQQVRPRRVGIATYQLTATNDSGTTTTQVQVRVTRAASRLRVTTSARSDLHLAGTRLKVTTRGLGKGEHYRVRVGHQVVATGKARRNGAVTRTVTVPTGTREGIRPVTVVGDKRDRRGRTTVHVVTARSLPVRVAAAQVRASDPQTLTVRGLAPGERVGITVDGARVSPASAVADASGRYRVTFAESTDWGTRRVRVEGAFPSRTGTTTYAVVQRCPGGSPCA